MPSLGPPSGTPAPPDGLLTDCGLLTIENYDECIKSRAATITDADVMTTIMWSIITGATCYILFVIVRKFDKVYQTRLELPWIWVKPPKLRLNGFHCLWSWLDPVYNLSDVQVLKTSGIDALVFLRCLRLAAQLMLPICIISCVVLIPVHKFCAPPVESADVSTDTSVTRTYSMSAFNLAHGSHLYWIHFTLLWVYVAYACWLLLETYKAVVRLRQDHFFISGEDYNPWVQHFLQTDASLQADEEVKKNKPKGGVLGLVERMGTFISPSHLDEDDLSSQANTGMKTVQLTRDTVFFEPFLEEAPPDLPSNKSSWFSFSKRKKEESAKETEMMVEDEGTKRDVKDPAMAFRSIPEDESVHNGSTGLDRAGSDTETTVIHDDGAVVSPAPLRMDRSFTLNDRLLMSSKSLDDSYLDDAPQAVYRWWEEHKGEGDLPALLGKPTVRFRKMINVLTDDGKNFGVNAQQYAVLVRDLPSVEWERIKKDIKFSVFRTAVDFKIHTWWPFSRMARHSETFKTIASEAEQLDSMTLKSEPDVEMGSSLIGESSVRGSLRGSVKGGDSSTAGVIRSHQKNPSLATLRRRFMPWKQHSHERNESNMFETFEQREIRKGEEQLEFIDNHFRKLFPDSFLQVVPVRKQKRLDYLLYLYDETIQQLDVAEEVYNRTGKRRRRYVNPLDRLAQGFCVSWFGMGYTVFCCCRPCCRPCMGFTADAIDYLTERKSKLEDEIRELRNSVLKGPVTGNYFALFNNQRDAALAVQTNLFPEGPGVFTVERAPGPDEINWSALWVRSFWRRQFRVFLVFPFILALLLFPVSIFAASMAELNYALCSTTESPVYSEWYCIHSSIWFREFVTSVLPSVLMVAYENLVMPMALYYLVLAQRQHPSFTSMEINIGGLYFAWNFFNFFLGGLLGGTIFAQLAMVVNDPGAVYDLVGTALSTQCNFFVNYVAFRALGTVWLKLLYPHFNIVPGIFFGLGIAKSRTPRQKAMQIAPHNLRYGREYGVYLLVMMVSLSFAVIAPLILPFTITYYIAAYAVFKYQVLYVYERAYESGGLHWPSVFTRICWCLFLMVAITACMLISRQAFIQGTVLLITLPPFIYQFHKYCVMRFGQRMEHIPLEIADAMPKAFLDPAMYVPPALREGSVGWYPEYGKCWEYWWMPLYTL